MKIREEEFNKAVNKLSQARLSNDRKDAMLKQFYAATKPKPDGEAGMIKSPWSFSFIAAHRYASVCAVVLMMFGGTAYASTQSLPGDLLYNFKVEVMEPLTLSAYWDEDSREQYKVSRLQERIKELQALRESGHIDSEASYASYAATQKNVTDLETSAVFDKDGQNHEVSAFINSYNSIAEEEFRVKTVINLDDGDDQEENKDATTTSVEVEVDLPDKVEEPVEEVIKEATNTVKKVEEETQPLIEETLEPVEEVTGSLTEELGL